MEQEIYQQWAMSQPNEEGEQTRKNLFYAKFYLDKFKQMFETYIQEGDISFGILKSEEE